MKRRLAEEPAAPAAEAAAAARNKRRATAAEVSAGVRRCLDALAAWEGRRFVGAQTGYRNKIAYSLRAGAVHPSYSPLASEQCNAVVRTVSTWVSERVASGELASDAVSEVSVKVGRAGAVLLKLLLRCADGAPAAALLAGPAAALAAAARAAHPRIQCVAAQHAPTRARPTKEAPYVLLHGDGLAEATPLGDAYELSPDAFSEVNHEAEDALWRRCLVGPEGMLAGGEGEASEKKDLLLMGRDSTAALASLLPAHRAVFAHAACLTHCPRVAEDLRRTAARGRLGERGAGAAGGGSGGGALPGTGQRQTAEVRGVPSKFAYAEALSAVCGGAEGRRTTVLCSAGRGGLAAASSAALRAAHRVDRIVYIACSQATCYQDMDVLLGSGCGGAAEVKTSTPSSPPPPPFYIHSYQSFDFQPGTGYVMQAFELRRREDGGQGRTGRAGVFIPVGPPGCGKSTVGRLLRGAMVGCGGVEEGVAIVERDAVYAAVRAEPGAGGLKKARRETHARVLAALEACPTRFAYYDSTCGDPGGRALVRDRFFGAGEERGAGGAHRLFACVSYAVANGADGFLDWLVQNCLARTGHPSFPDTVDEARTKISNVLLGIRAPTAEGKEEEEEEGRVTGIDEARVSDGSSGAAAIPLTAVVVEVNPRECRPEGVASVLHALCLLDPRLLEGGEVEVEAKEGDEGLHEKEGQEDRAGLPSLLCKGLTGVRMTACRRVVSQS